MENKINIAELLRDCPSGMELDCTMFKDVYFDYVDKLNIIHCYIQRETCKTSITFNQHGQYIGADFAKCVIFQKGKTTWEGFVPPCKFKGGDVVVAEDGELFQLFLLKHLTHSKEDNGYDGYCYFGWDFQRNKLFEKGNWGFDRLATEEEKQKLFDAIKKNGYKWNTETKTLEKVTKPKFKAGDKVRHKNNHNVVFTISSIKEDSYVRGGKMAFSFDEQDNYELVPNKFDLTTLKPFESRVLVRDKNTEKWKSNFWGFYDIDNAMNYPYECCGCSFSQCIPYEGNEHLLGNTDDCDDFYKTW